MNYLTIFINDEDGMETLQLLGVTVAGVAVAAFILSFARKLERKSKQTWNNTKEMDEKLMELHKE